MISSRNNDPLRLKKHHKNRSEENEIIRSFKEDSTDTLAILIVCDKLLTGFDAPVEQVMYLDRPLREHTLLQAIARVNRTAENKTYGLVVDYWGITKDLRKSLEVFKFADIEKALTPKTDELPRLEERHRIVMSFFDKIDKNDIELCIKILEPEDIRADFDLKFRRFSQSMDMVLPEPAALKYSNDLRWLGKLRNAARIRFRDSSLDISLCGAKVRDIIEKHIRVNGIKKLNEPVSIFSDKFYESVELLQNDKAKASEIEHAIRYELHLRLYENPVFYQSLKERLEQIISNRKEARISEVEKLKSLEALVIEMRNIRKNAQNLGLSEIEFALYEILKDEKEPQKKRPDILIKSSTSEYKKSNNDFKDLTRNIIGRLETLTVIDWIHKDDVKREMRKQIKGILREKGFEFDEIENLTDKIMNLARAQLSK